MKRRSRTIPTIILAGVFVLGYLLGGTPRESQHGIHEEIHEQVEEQETVWTCSMHPKVRQPSPGKCPLCAMDLIPVTSDRQDENQTATLLSLSPSAQRLARVHTTLVERKYIDAQVRLFGKIDFDETRLAVISAWVPGRIERLFVDYTGTRVNKGDHLVSLFSPELLTAQQELIEAKKGRQNLENSNLQNVIASAAQMEKSAREKLRLLGLTEKQIQEIESGGKASDRLTIYSPMGGIVIHKNATEGMYVNTGTKIYTIADLTHLWVRLDAYESELAFLRYGQEAEFETESYPGEVFKGKISFIDPILNEKTRTVKVRVNMPNTEGKLKPGMFVRGLVHTRIAQGGKVLAPDLAGKWISPMHPEIVKEEPGKCDICGMPLVRAETLGYVDENDQGLTPPLVIPATAPLKTGKRALVYVLVPDKEGTFEQREIVLGQRTGNHYIVQSGLREGDLVVTRGNFKIDSAIQLLGKPSMMSPEEGSLPSSGHHHTKIPSS